MGRIKRLAAVEEAAQLLKDAARDLEGKDPFRADALMQLGFCAGDLATTRVFQLSLPRGEVTMNEADGGPHYMPQTSGMTSGNIRVRPAPKEPA